MQQPIFRNLQKTFKNKKIKKNKTDPFFKHERQILKTIKSLNPNSKNDDER